MSLLRTVAAEADAAQSIVRSVSVSAAATSGSALGIALLNEIGGGHPAAVIGTGQAMALRSFRTPLHLFLVLARDCRVAARARRNPGQTMVPVIASMRRRWAAAAPSLSMFLRDEA